MTTERSPGCGGKPAMKLVPLGVARLDDPAPSVEPHDQGRAFEGAEHDRHPPILSQVGDGLDSAAGQVEVGHRRGTEDRGTCPVPWARCSNVLRGELGAVPTKKTRCRR